MNSNKWFSVGENHILDEDDDPYCRYCYTNFKEYREMIGGICQSCGRPSEFLTREKQSKLQLSSLNEPISPEDMKGLSLDFVYTSLEQEDETKSGMNSATHIQANSLKEAINKMWEIDTQTADKYRPFRKIIRGYDDKYTKLDERD